MTVGRCSSYSWRCLTSSTPGFSSSGLFLAASPSQRQVKKKKWKERKKSVASRPKTRGAAQHHIQATSAPPQSSILALQQSTVPVSVTTSKVLTIAPPAVVGIISPHQRWWASSQRSARRVEIEKCSQTHMSLTCRSWWGPRARNRAPTADFYRKKNDAHHYTKETKAV